MSQEAVYKIFQQSIEAKMDAAEVLFPDIVEAADMIVDCLLNGGKILVCGNGLSAAIGQILTNNLVNRFERDRPGLPAISLGCNLTSVTSIANEKNFNEVFAREIKTLGSNKDLLIVLTCSGNPSNLIQAVQVANEKNMQSITLNASDGGNISSLLDLNSKEIRVPSSSAARIHEIHLLIIFCLCHLIDDQLFGPIQP